MIKKIINRKLIIKKIYINKNKKIIKEITKKISNLVFLNKSFFIKIIFVDNIFFNKLSCNFIEKCYGGMIVFNYNYSIIMFEHYNSEIYVDEEKFIKNNIFYSNKYKKYLIHSFLHIIGYDHIKKKSFLKMNKKMNFFLRKLK
ncbi:rRNA maturation RNAse YbeY [Candidatus Vidania fulgoroideorum]